MCIRDRGKGAVAAMMHKSSATFDVAVITVCVDGRTTEQIVETVESTHWAVTSATFDAYVSSVRRPYFGPQIGAAKSVIAVVDFDLDPEQAVESTRYLQAMFAGKVTVMALAESRDPDLLLLAMRGGLSLIHLSAPTKTR